MKRLTIAIDGPSGAGKGTVARAVAGALGYRHVDSGAMYRAVAWKALHLSIPLDDEAAVAEIAESADISVMGTVVTIDNVDVTRQIRTPEIDRAAAAVARLPAVRRALVDRQRRYSDDGVGIVMEGRDIGTVVFPRADVKVYLDATAEERARRRANDPAHTGGPAQVAEVVTLLSERDHSDQTRTASPLYAAPDAVFIDTTGKTVDEVVATVMEIVSAALSAAPSA
jgi:cytidylate kinase